MKSITILPGTDKNGRKEDFDEITLNSGSIYAIVGNTGSGKSRLMKDIEALSAQDTITRRTVLVDGKTVPLEARSHLSFSLIAHLGQYMRFSVDTTIEDFLDLHARSRGVKVSKEEIIEDANKITNEPIGLQMNLTELSGGQSRALMVSDIAHISDCPVVLIDEIENAGINKDEAIKQLVRKEKLVLLSTHDIHTALYAEERLVMKNGAIAKARKRSEKETILFEILTKNQEIQNKRQQMLRNGDEII